MNLRVSNYHLIYVYQPNFKSREGVSLPYVHTAGGPDS